MHFGLLSPLDFSVDLVGALYSPSARTMLPRILERWPLRNSRTPPRHRLSDSHLFRSEPQRELTGVMLDQKANEPLVRAQRRAMDAQRSLFGVVAVAIDQAKFAGTAKSTWLVARVNSRPMTLQTCTSIFGP